MFRKLFSLIIFIIVLSIILLLIYSLSLPSLARGDGATPGPYLVMAFKAPFTPSLTATPPYGILLISEVMVQPASFEPDGEWVELFNSGGGVIDLSTYKLGDEVVQGNPEGMYQFPAGAAIDPGQVILIANRADVFTTTYGFYPDYELIESDGNVPNMSKYTTWAGGWMNLSIPGDEVLALGETDSFVDAVSWGDSIWIFDPTCPVVAEGHSIERYPADVDTDTAADWIDQALPNPGQVYFVHFRGGNF